MLALSKKTKNPKQQHETNKQKNPQPYFQFLSFVQNWTFSSKEVNSCPLAPLLETFIQWLKYGHTPRFVVCDSCRDQWLGLGVVWSFWESRAHCATHILAFLGVFHYNIVVWIWIWFRLSSPMSFDSSLHFTVYLCTSALVAKSALSPDQSLFAFTFQM